MLANTSKKTVYLLLFTLTLFLVPSLASAGLLIKCDDRLLINMKKCRAYKCTLESDVSVLAAKHTIRGVDSNGKCKYVIAPNTFKKDICHFSRESMAELITAMGAVLNSPDDRYARIEVNELFGKGCVETDKRDTVSMDSPPNYYNVAGKKYPYLDIQKTCPNKNDVTDVLVTSGKYKFKLDVNDIVQIIDRATPYGSYRGEFKEFTRRTCADLNVDMLRFNEIQFNPFKVDPVFETRNESEIKVTLLNPDNALSKDFSRQVTDSYKKILRNTDKLSEENIRDLRAGISQDEDEKFYKIFKDYGRPVDGIKPFILIDKNGLKTRANNKFVLECRRKNQQTVCETRWVWGANIVVSVDNIPYPVKGYEKLVSKVNNYLDSAFKGSN